MMPSELRDLREALARGCGGYVAGIAHQAFPDFSEQAAQAEASKYIGPNHSRGDSFVRLIETIVKSGGARSLIEWAEQYDHVDLT